MECSNVGKKRGEGTSLYGAIIQNADYMLDMDMMNNQKRKRVRVDVDDSRCDETLLSFLTDLEEYLESRVEGEDDDDEEDPIYVRFLENLEEYGKCYMLGVSLEHGVRSPIMYEVEDDPLVVPGRESPRSRRGVCNRKEGRSGVDRLMKSRRIDSSNKNERRASVKKDGLGSEAGRGSFDVNANEGSRSNHRYNMRKRRGLEVHEQSKSFVTNSSTQKRRGLEVHKQSKSFVTNSNTQKRGGAKAYEKSKSGVNRRSTRGVNEDEGDHSQEIRRKSSRTSKSGGDAQDERARETDETYKTFMAATKVVGDSMVCEFSDHQQVAYDGSFQQTPTEAKIEAASRQPTHAPTFLDSCAPTSLPTPGTKVVGDSMVCEFSDHQQVIYDGSFQQTPTEAKIEAASQQPTHAPTFLNSCAPTSLPTPGTKVVGDSMVCEFSGHQQVVYDGSFQQTPTEAKIEAASQQPTHAPAIHDSGAPTSLPTPSVKEPITTTTPVSPTVNNNSRNSSVTDKNVHNSKKESREDHSNHWRKLRKILLKPFDQNELDELWNDMSSRSQVQIYRDSRSGGTYKPGHWGKSYLDRYPELKDEIKKVESDSLKVLNLLRMLSFYLKMVPHGIPKPWLPEYRKMFFT